MGLYGTEAISFHSVYGSNLVEMSGDTFDQLRKAALSESCQILLSRFGWLHETRPMCAHCGKESGRVQTEDFAKKLIRSNGPDSVWEVVGGKVFQVEREDDLDIGRDSSRKHMPVVEVGECQRRYQRFVPGHESIGNGTVHFRASSFQTFAFEVRPIEE